jgi:hypothetical protein
MSGWCLWWSAEDGQGEIEMGAYPTVDLARGRILVARAEMVEQGLGVNEIDVGVWSLAWDPRAQPDATSEARAELLALARTLPAPDDVRLYIRSPDGGGPWERVWDWYARLEGGAR